jgi:hypothetical protein
MSQWWKRTTVGAFALSACAAAAPIQDVPIMQPKAWINVEPKNVSLIWNGDEGENGRNRGEVFCSIWVYWPSNAECTNPQHREYGPLGGDAEFPSGLLKEVPPGSGNWTIEPATVPIVGTVYRCEANCPVADHIFVEAYFWESDSNNDLNDYIKKITGAIDDAAEDAAQANAALSFVQVITAGVEVLVDILTKSSDDDLGRFSGFVSFPSPCLGPFCVEREVDLENLAAALWTDVEAADDQGRNFGDPPYNLTPPANIGKLRLKICGGLVVNKFCVVMFAVNAQSSTELRTLDVGQPDEATISAWIELGACLPSVPNGATYAVGFDSDTDLATGSPQPGLQGADFAVFATIAPNGACAASLQAWNEDNAAFEPMPAGLYDAEFDIDRQAILITVERTALGPAATALASRAAVFVGAELVSQLPADGDAAGVIALSPEPTGVLPTVSGSIPGNGQIDVDPAAVIELRFSKAMQRIQTLVATSIAPPIQFVPSWIGDRLLLKPVVPLAPDTDYHVVVQPFATDTVGSPFDGNGDLLPGDPFLLPFSTAPEPLSVTTLGGDQADAFREGEPMLLTIADLPDVAPGAAVHVVADVRRGLLDGELLVDQSDNGPDPLIVNAKGGAITILLGAVAEQGEYHVVLDLDGDGAYQRGIDRIDRTGIGLVILPDCDLSGVIDAFEIADGTLLDSDGDGKPDVCETPACPADLDGDGVVGGKDLAIMLSSWGPCGGCPSDIVASGEVDGADLTVLLGNWGPCG